MFDAAHAMGSHHQGRPIGGFGLAEIFSFHATKVMNAFEGGAIATNDVELARKVRLMNNFGFTGLDTVEYIGMNGKMNEASAAMGLTSLESLDEFVRANSKNHSAYASGINAIPGLNLASYQPEHRAAQQYVVIEVDERTAGISRDNLLMTLHAENIRARRYFFPGCHRMEPYRSAKNTAYDLPVTESLCKRVLCLPTGMAVNGEVIDRICGVLASAISHADEINEKLSENQEFYQLVAQP